MIERFSHADRALRRAEIAKTVEDAPVHERRDLVLKLSRDHDLSGTTMRAILRQYNVDVPASPAQIVKDSTLGVIAALQRGESHVSIAEGFMISKQRVKQIKDAALDAGIVMP